MTVSQQRGNLVRWWTAWWVNRSSTPKRTAANERAWSSTRWRPSPLSTSSSLTTTSSFTSTTWSKLHKLCGCPDPPSHMTETKCSTCWNIWSIWSSTCSSDHQREKYRLEKKNSHNGKKTGLILLRIILFLCAGTFQTVIYDLIKPSK